jgi:hypothetical protein
MRVENRFFWVQLLIAAGLILSCTTTTTAGPTTDPSTQTFQNPTAGIRFKYPADWVSKKAPTALLDVVDPSDTDGAASLSLDVPELPRFFRAMITPKMIENGYVKDLRKNQIHDAVVDESVELKLPDSSARRVKCSGHDKGKVEIDVAVLIIHLNRVYIFSCDSDEAGYSTARKALDDAVASVQWIK